MAWKVLLYPSYLYDLSHKVLSKHLKLQVFVRFCRQLPFAAAVTLLLLSGCASTQPAGPRARFFWPPLPDTPRLEWLGEYTNRLDLPMTPFESFIESVAGAEHIRFERPWGIAADGKGKVYVTDMGQASVIVYDFTKNTVSILGKEEAVGLFKGPIGVAVDGAGNVYVTDPMSHKVFVFDRNEKPLMSIGSEATLERPVGVIINDDLKRVYVLNAYKHNVAVFDLSGNHLFSFGRRGARSGEFNFPSGIDLDSKGNVVVADAANARVQIFDPDGKFIRRFGQRGDGVADFQMIKGVAVDRMTDQMYVVDGRGHKIVIFSPEGEALLSVGGTAFSVGAKRGPGGFLIPTDIDIVNGRIYVVDSLNRRFQVFQIVTEEWLKVNPISQE